MPFARTPFRLMLLAVTLALAGCGVRSGLHSAAEDDAPESTAGAAAEGGEATNESGGAVAVEGSGEATVGAGEGQEATPGPPLPEAADGGSAGPREGAIRDLFPSLRIDRDVDALVKLGPKLEPGAETAGDIAAGQIAAHLFVASTSDNVRITVHAGGEGGQGRAALAIYGPPDRFGRFGEPRAIHPNAAGAVEFALDFEVPLGGRYLALLAAKPAGAAVSYRVELTCAGAGCSAPAALCPDALECTKFCASGFVISPSECQTCQCAASGCAGHADCAAGALCLGNTCVLQPLDCSPFAKPGPKTFCGVDGVTYTSACDAANAGVPGSPGGLACIHGEPAEGAEGTGAIEPDCRLDSDCDTSSVCANGACVPLSVPAGECGCDKIYNPVCATNGKTYGNVCILECAGAELALAGECVSAPSCGGVSSVGCPPGFYCRPAYANFDIPGQCQAAIACEDSGGCPAQLACLRGTCLPRANCGCPAEVVSPVCGSDGKNYRNDCEAQCAGTGVSYFGRCECADICKDQDSGICADNGQRYACESELLCNGLLRATEALCKAAGNHPGTLDGGMPPPAEGGESGLDAGTTSGLACDADAGADCP